MPNGLPKKAVTHLQSTEERVGGWSMWAVEQVESLSSSSTVYLPMLMLRTSAKLGARQGIITPTDYRHRWPELPPPVNSRQGINRALAPHLEG